MATTTKEPKKERKPYDQLTREEWCALSPEEKNEYMEEQVVITLPLVLGALEDDEYVSINERNWVIKRGEQVTVPRMVAELLKDKQNQELSAASRQRALTSDFEAKSKSYLG